MTYFNMQILVCVCIGALILSSVECARSSDKVLLRNFEVLTLYHGQYTTGRRSSRVPQLKCMGGTAGCSAFVPQVVQCYNRGTDGSEVQWECKTDMDNAFRFGEISVSCEGYDYPEDPFILKGSCGMEYEIDLTKEGHARGYQSHGARHHDGDGKHSYVGTLVMFVVICGILYVVYKQFLSGPTHAADAPPPHAPPPYSAEPPPPGFRPEYMPPPAFSGGSSSSYGSTGYGYQSPSGMGSGTYSQPSTGGTNSCGGGGFWSGAATGGVLGYLLGSSTSRQRHHQPYNDYGWGSSSHWGSSSGSFGSGSHSSGTTSSSGTRTASGFGSTKRR